jgi:hypothetical protein
MNMFLDFFIIIFNNHMFEIGLKKVYWNTSKDHNLFLNLFILNFKLMVH